MPSFDHRAKVQFGVPKGVPTEQEKRAKASAGAGSAEFFDSEKRIKISLGSLSPIEYRVSLGLAA